MVIYNKSFKERLNFNWLEHSTAKENSSIYFLSVPINQFFHASDVLNFAMKEESNWLKQSGWWVWCLFIYTQKVCLLFEKKNTHSAKWQAKNNKANGEKRDGTNHWKPIQLSHQNTEKNINWYLKR